MALPGLHVHDSQSRFDPLIYKKGCSNIYWKKYTLSFWQQKYFKQLNFGRTKRVAGKTLGYRYGSRVITSIFLISWKNIWPKWRSMLIMSHLSVCCGLSWVKLGIEFSLKLRTGFRQFGNIFNGVKWSLLYSMVKGALWVFWGN